MLLLGTSAADFSLTATDGKTVSLKDFSKQPLLVVFMCNHCPYVVHLKKELATLGDELKTKCIAMVGINSNDAVHYSEDHPDKMKRDVAQYGYTFPYLFDETQEVAKSYQAACTPDFFLFDATHKLVYRGQYDDSRPGNNKPISGRDLKGAIAHLLAGEPISSDQKPSIGCNIKWKKNS